MELIEFKLEGKVAVLTLAREDNRLNLELCDAWLSLLDKVEEQTDASTLVVKSAHSHIWSNGFDLDWVNGRLEAGDKASVVRFLLRDMELRQRLLTYPLITIAALNGHVFGGAAVLSCCFDFRFMRSDRGFFCIPVVDKGFPIVPGTAELLASVFPPHMIEDVILCGRRFTGAECAHNSIVTAAYPNDELISKIMDFASGLDKERRVVGRMKRVLNGRIVNLMERDKELLQAGSIRV